MKRLIPLMQREWLQHRVGWALMLGLPLALGLLLIGYGQIQIDGAGPDSLGAELPVALALGGVAGTMALLFVIVGISSLIIVSGLPRRDHGDRSIEFWLSLPLGHSESLAAPLLVHLVLAPACALLVGLGGGYLVSLVLVTRVAGFGSWLALPWGTVVPATLALALRVVAGLPLAVLWLSPLILLVMLMTAWFKRWGWVILTAGIGLGSLLLKRLLGEPFLVDAANQLVLRAGQAMVAASAPEFQVKTAADMGRAFDALPAWAWHDYVAALGALASPLLLGGLLVASSCFALLVLWRQRGAGAAAA
ncbi:MAG: hypothetical protein KGI90_09125 [Burkholderiales bacterium]|nr:hypothetical protein [Burkholderiales bacterium]MDE2274713.1 hypothetical protein [Burkholderiales bacterium]